jgi:hypothetical protein
MEPLWPQAAKIASGGRRAAHSPVKRGSIAVLCGTIG